MFILATDDLVQVAVDKPHIRQAYDGFHHRAGLWCRLNPDLAYVEGLVGARRGNAFPDNPADTEPRDWMEVRTWGYRTPAGSQITGVLVPLAAVAEMVVRVWPNNWEANLDEPLFQMKRSGVRS